MAYASIILERANTGYVRFTSALDVAARSHKAGIADATSAAVSEVDRRTVVANVLAVEAKTVRLRARPIAAGALGAVRTAITWWTVACPCTSVAEILHSAVEKIHVADAAGGQRDGARGGAATPAVTKQTSGAVGVHIKVAERIIGEAGAIRGVVDCVIIAYPLIGADCRDGGGITNHLREWWRNRAVGLTIRSKESTWAHTYPVPTCSVICAAWGATIDCIRIGNRAVRRDGKLA